MVLLRTCACPHMAERRAPKRASSAHLIGTLIAPLTPTPRATSSDAFLGVSGAMSSDAFLGVSSNDLPAALRGGAAAQRRTPGPIALMEAKEQDASGAAAAGTGAGACSGSGGNDGN
jgi:hypothetical protein